MGFLVNESMRPAAGTAAGGATVAGRRCRVGTRPATGYTVYSDPPEHGAPVWCSIIFPNPAHLHLFSYAGSQHRPSPITVPPSAISPDPAASTHPIHGHDPSDAQPSESGQPPIFAIHHRSRLPGNQLHDLRRQQVRRPTISTTISLPSAWTTSCSSSMADSTHGPAAPIFPSTASHLQQLVTTLRHHESNPSPPSRRSPPSNAGKPSTHLHHAHEQNPSRPNQAGSPHFSHFFVHHHGPASSIFVLHAPATGGELHHHACQQPSAHLMIDDPTPHEPASMPVRLPTTTRRLLHPPICIWPRSHEPARHKPTATI
ncbi:hypothetical protein ACLOJK_027826 [Asimina triloba]